MRQRVQQVITDAGVSGADVLVEAFGPDFESGEQLFIAGFDCGEHFPFSDAVLVELQKNALAVDLGRGLANFGQAERGRADAEVVLTLQVGGDGLDAGEADLDPNLAQAVGEDDPLYAGRQLAGARGKAANKEIAVAVRGVARGFHGRLGEFPKFGGTQWLAGMIFPSWQAFTAARTAASLNFPSLFFTSGMVRKAKRSRGSRRTGFSTGRRRRR